MRAIVKAQIVSEADSFKEVPLWSPKAVDDANAPNFNRLSSTSTLSFSPSALRERREGEGRGEGG